MKIVVIGLLPGQATIIKREVGKRAKLRFISTEERAVSLPAADHCILMLKFINHIASTRAMKNYPRHRVHYHNGGLSTVSNLITNLVESHRGS